MSLYCPRAGRLMGQLGSLNFHLKGCTARLMGVSLMEGAVSPTGNDERDATEVSTE